jgi:3-hydroxyisobutyrate dehydrogenase-like beta-hydroxyacid dehydrogenase
VTTVGLLHPGEMGASIGAALVRAGHEVRWASEGRGDATRRRAVAAALTDAGTIGAVAASADVVVSICPPDAAEPMAAEVHTAGFTGTYVDANAVSPATARRIAAAVPAASFVDGDVIGGPVRPGGGSTRIYLSGPQAGEVAALFATGDPEVVVLGADPTAASTLKMCYAAWTKGTSALVLAIAAVADQAGVTDALLSEWAHSQPDLPARVVAAVTGTPRKAWRYEGEMREIAATFEAAGLPGGHAEAAAEIYRRLAGFKASPADAPPDAEAVIQALLVDPERLTLEA